MTVWQTALYTRLSREDGDRLESDSILNQRKLLTAHMEHHSDMELCGDYADDGHTGTNFDRPAFQRMIRDIELGKINCVMVKDLSRFGRDYIETGIYLERWFPEHNVRFIAVNDQIDTQRGPVDMMVPLKIYLIPSTQRISPQRSKAHLRLNRTGASSLAPLPVMGMRKTLRTRTDWSSIRWQQLLSSVYSVCLKAEWERSRSRKY